MTVLSVTLDILSDIWSITLPFGLTFGALLLFAWSVPLVVKLIKAIF